MRRKSDTPTRSEVTGKVEESKNEMSEGIENLDVIATDSETVEGTLDSLDFSGTTEGTGEVEEAIEQASAATTEKFDEEDDALEQVQAETEEYEGELQERIDTSQSDNEKIFDAAGKIETQETTSELEKGKDAVADDIEFLNEQNETAKVAREENEQLQQEHRGRLQGGRR